MIQVFISETQRNAENETVHDHDEVQRLNLTLFPSLWRQNNKTYLNTLSVG